MAAPQRLAGIANVTIDGTTREVAGDFSWSSQITHNEVLKSMSSNMPGYKQTPVAAYIEFTGRDMSNTPLSTYANAVNATVVAVLASGKILTGQNMVIVDAIAVNSVEATMKLRFEAATVTESTTT